MRGVCPSRLTNLSWSRFQLGTNQTDAVIILVDPNNHENLDGRSRDPHRYRSHQGQKPPPRSKLPGRAATRLRALPPTDVTAAAEIETVGGVAERRGTAKVTPSVLEARVTSRSCTHTRIHISRVLPQDEDGSGTRGHRRICDTASKWNRRRATIGSASCRPPVPLAVKRRHGRLHEIGRWANGLQRTDSSNWVFDVRFRLSTDYL